MDYRDEYKRLYEENLRKMSKYNEDAPRFQSPHAAEWFTWAGLIQYTVIGVCIFLFTKAIGRTIRRKFERFYQARLSQQDGSIQAQRLYTRSECAGELLRDTVLFCFFAPFRIVRFFFVTSWQMLTFALGPFIPIVDLSREAFAGLVNVYYAVVESHLYRVCANWLNFFTSNTFILRVLISVFWLILGLRLLTNINPLTARGDHPPTEGSSSHYIDPYPDLVSTYDLSSTAGQDYYDKHCIQYEKHFWRCRDASDTESFTLNFEDQSTTTEPHFEDLFTNPEPRYEDLVTSPEPHFEDLFTHREPRYEGLVTAPEPHYEDLVTIPEPYFEELVTTSEPHFEALVTTAEAPITTTASEDYTLDYTSDDAPLAKAQYAHWAEQARRRASSIASEVDEAVSGASSWLSKGVSAGTRKIQDGRSSAAAQLNNAISQGSRKIQDGRSNAASRLNKAYSEGARKIQDGQSNAAAHLNRAFSEAYAGRQPGAGSSEPYTFETAPHAPPVTAEVPESVYVSWTESKRRSAEEKLLGPKTTATDAGPDESEAIVLSPSWGTVVEESASEADFLFEEGQWRFEFVGEAVEVHPASADEEAPRAEAEVEAEAEAKVETLVTGAALRKAAPGAGPSTPTSLAEQKKEKEEREEEGQEDSSREWRHCQTCAQSHCCEWHGEGDAHSSV